MAAWLVCGLWNGGGLASQVATEAGRGAEARACVGLRKPTSSMPLLCFPTEYYALPDYTYWTINCKPMFVNIVLIRALSIVDALIAVETRSWIFRARSVLEP